MESLGRFSCASSTLNAVINKNDTFWKLKYERDIHFNRKKIFSPSRKTIGINTCNSREEYRIAFIRLKKLNVKTKEKWIRTASNALIYNYIVAFKKIFNSNVFSLEKLKKYEEKIIRKSIKRGSLEALYEFDAMGFNFDERKEYLQKASSEARKEFIEFFILKGHTYYRSYPFSKFPIYNTEVTSRSVILICTGRTIHGR